MDFGIRIHATGGPEQMQWEPLDVPAPARGELRLRHTAVGVNFLDCYHRSGLYPVPLPSGLGSEAVGLVEAVGDGVAGVQVGDRVAYAGGVPPGAYATARTVPAWRCVPVPAEIDDTTAAALLLKGLTAEYLVRRVFRVGPGHRVLVHAAAGGTGSLLCQWLRHLGAVVVGAVSSPAKVAAAFANGCHQVIDTSAQDLVADVRSFTKDKGVDVVYDGTGRDTLRSSLQCLRQRGLLVSFGNASGRPEPIDLAELQRGSWFVTRPVLLDYTSTRQELTNAAEVLWKLVRPGVLKARLDGTFPLADAAAAHRRLESRQSQGAIVLLP
jgi:NADPH2:quinone reductase